MVVPSAPGRCPICESAMRTEKVRCVSCNTALEGTFALDWPQQLTREQLAFARVFISCHGKIKDVEDALGISYPTVVSRLEEVVEAIQINAAPPTQRLEILADLAAGKISADEAEKKLRKKETR